MQKCPVELRHCCPNTPIYAINLRKAGSYFDSITYFGCDIKETNEYFELNRVVSALGYSRERRDLLTEYTNNNKNGTIITLKKSLMKNIKNILNLLNLMNSKKKNMY